MRRRLLLLPVLLLPPLLQCLVVHGGSTAAVPSSAGGQHCCLQCSAVHPHGCALPDLHWMTFFAERIRRSIHRDMAVHYVLCMVRMGCGWGAALAQLSAAAAGCRLCGLL
jgi:hypothetical protein